MVRFAARGTDCVCSAADLSTGGGWADEVALPTVSLARVLWAHLPAQTRTLYPSSTSQILVARDKRVYLVVRYILTIQIDKAKIASGCLTQEY